MLELLAVLLFALALRPWRAYKAFRQPRVELASRPGSRGRVFSVRPGRPRALALLLALGLIAPSSMGREPGLLQRYTKAGLPTPGKAGRVASVSDDARGFWMDSGVQWVQIAGEVANIEDFGAIAGNVSAPQRALNHSAINSALATGKPVYVPPKEYQIHSALILTSPTHDGITIYGHKGQSTISTSLAYIAGTGGNAVIRVNGAKRVTIARLVVKSLNAVGTTVTARGIHCDTDADDVTIQDCEVYNFRQAGIVIRDLKRGRVADNLVHDIGTDAMFPGADPINPDEVIAPINMAGVLYYSICRGNIVHTFADDPAWSTIANHHAIYHSASDGQRNIITENIIYDGSTGISVAQGAPAGVVVADNVIFGMLYGMEIEAGGGENIVIANNYLQRTVARPGNFIDSVVNNAVIAGNVIDVGPSGNIVAIKVQNNGVSITGNIISADSPVAGKEQSTTTGIEIAVGRNVSVIGNHMRELGRAVIVMESASGLIEDVVVQGNTFRKTATLAADGVAIPAHAALGYFRMQGLNAANRVQTVLLQWNITDLGDVAGQFGIVIDQVDGAVVRGNIDHTAGANSRHGKVTAGVNLVVERNYTNALPFDPAANSPANKVVIRENRKFSAGDVGTLADAATPSVVPSGDAALLLKTGGTTTITGLTDGWAAQVVTILAAHTVTVQHNANIQLSGGNFGMVAGDTLTLTLRETGVWYEVTRTRAGGIVNADIAASAAIAKSKLAALGIVDADVAAGAGIAKSKLAPLALVNADVDAAAAISGDKVSAAAAGVRGTVLKAADVAALTIDAGLPAANEAIEDMPALQATPMGIVADERAAIRRNFADLSTQINDLRTALRNAGIMQ